MAVVDDVAGTPTTKKATRLNFIGPGLRGASIFLDAYVVGRYYDGMGLPGSNAASQAYIADRVAYVPIYVPHSFTADRIGAHILTAGTAAARMRLGIYASGGDGLPDALVVDSGEIDVSATGFKEATISQALVGGTLYWAAWTQNESITFRASNQTFSPGLGYAAGSDVVGAAYLLETRSFAALPATAAPTSYQNGAAANRILLRAS